MSKRVCIGCGVPYGATHKEHCPKFEMSDSPTCSIADSRTEFEAWISAPPFERNTDRFPNDPRRHAWPDTYQVYEVELAWQAWLAARQ